MSPMNRKTVSAALFRGTWALYLADFFLLEHIAPGDRVISLGCPRFVGIERGGQPARLVTEHYIDKWLRGFRHWVPFDVLQQGLGLCRAFLVLCVQFLEGIDFAGEFRGSVRGFLFP